MLPPSPVWAREKRTCAWVQGTGQAVPYTTVTGRCAAEQAQVQVVQPSETELFCSTHS